MDASTSLGILVATAGAGVLGSMVGLGGGVFVVPILSVFFGVPLKTAIAASAVSVVVNSLSGTTVFLRHQMANLRLGLLLLVTTTLGAIAGGLLAVHASPDLLRLVFALSLYGMAAAMFRRGTLRPEPTSGPDPLGLTSTYHDPALNVDVSYTPRRLAPGMAISTVAGVISGMLGIGGGAIQVPVMHAIMQIPVKAAAATSVLMVGTTVVASATIYYLYDLIDLSVAVPAVLGMVLGAQSGARLARRAHAALLAWLLILILLYLATTVLLQAAGVHVPGSR